MSKRPVGRPAKENPKTVKVFVYMSEKEYTEARNRADKLGTSLSVMLRNAYKEVYGIRDDEKEESN